MKKIKTYWVLLCAAGLMSSAAMAADQRIAIGTGGSSGVFYAVGAGIANIINNDLPGVYATSQPTGASIENVYRVSSGEMALGFSSASTLSQAKDGRAPFKSKMPVAAVAHLYPAWAQIAVSRKSGIEDVSGLKDARISVGPPGGNSAVICQNVLKAYGALNPGKIQHLSYGEATEAMKNDQLDATCVLAGLPVPALIELTNTEKVRFLPVAKDKVAEIRKDYPYYTAETIPAGTYDGQDENVAAIGDPVILFTSTDADSDLIYNVTKTLFTHLDTLRNAHHMASFITLEGAADTPVPLQAGAKRFLDEAGAQSSAADAAPASGE